VEEKVILRPATPDDLEAILALQQTAPGAASWQPADYANAFADAAGLCLLAEDSVRARVAGFLVGRLAADEAEILNLAVAPGYRRQGIGRRLVAEALAVALAMPPAKRRARAGRLRRIVEERDLTSWLAGQLEDLRDVMASSHTRPARTSGPSRTR